MTESPFQTAINAMKAHLGEGRKAALGSEGAAWCATFVTDNLKKTGLGGALEGCDNLNYVPSLFAYGDKEHLTSSTKNGSTPPAGSLVSLHGQGHVMMVEEVLPGNKIKIIEGNWSNKVGERVLSLSEIDPSYIDANKMQQKLIAKGVPLPQPGQPSIPQQTAALSSEMTTPDPATGKAPSLTQLYDNHQKEAPEGQTGMMMMQMVVALLMMLSGKSDKIPSQQAYKNDPNAGREALQQIDKERAAAQTGMSAQLSTGTTVTPSTTPNVIAATPRVLQPH